MDSYAQKGRLVQIFRSPREEGLYLYVDRSEGLTRIPEALLAKFGKPESALMLMLDTQRKLARANTSQVLEAIRTQGFYLQLPPQPDQDMQLMRLNNTRLQ
jgi:uncharacterized protein YcgL (UPF0745 family)